MSTRDGFGRLMIDVRREGRGGALAEFKVEAEVPSRWCQRSSAVETNPKMDSFLDHVIAGDSGAGRVKIPHRGGCRSVSGLRDRLGSSDSRRIRGGQSPRARQPRRSGDALES